MYYILGDLYKAHIAKRENINNIEFFNIQRDCNIFKYTLWIGIEKFFHMLIYPEFDLQAY